MDNDIIWQITKSNMDHESNSQIEQQKNDFIHYND